MNLFRGRANSPALLSAVIGAALLWGAAQTTEPQARIIEILADHDSRYKIQGQKKPVITVRAGEPITLRITAKKAKNLNRDGSIHGFTLLRAMDRKPVPGWDFLLKPGTQEFAVTAPREAGEYVAVCTVICSQDHEGMSMRLLFGLDSGAESIFNRWRRRGKK